MSAARNATTRGRRVESAQQNHTHNKNSTVARLYNVVIGDRRHLECTFYTTISYAKAKAGNRHTYDLRLRLGGGTPC